MELQHSAAQAGSHHNSQLGSHGSSPAGSQAHAQASNHLPTATYEGDSAPVDRVLIIAYRKNIKESQRRFWARFGVTQSRGSRFESGAEIPAPVSLLLGLYFNKIISDDDLERAERVVYHRETRTLINLGQ